MLIHDTVTYTEHAKRKTRRTPRKTGLMADGTLSWKFIYLSKNVIAMEIVYALKHQGCIVYGFGDEQHFFFPKHGFFKSHYI